MSIGILAKKIGMTQVFNESGKQVPVTVLKVEPTYVVQKRTMEKDGYEALQLGSFSKKKVNKPLGGHFKAANRGNFQFLKEIRTHNIEDVSVGSQVSLDQFEKGDFVNVRSKSIGKGYQGVVKRHGFAGGPGGHGSMFHRRVGSISGKGGGKACAKKVIRGKKMPGQMGSGNITIQNLEIVELDLENNLLILKGGVPGAGQNLVVIENSFKRSPSKEWKFIEEVEEKEEVKEEATAEDVKQQKPAEEKEEVKDEAKEGSVEEKSEDNREEK